MTLYQQVTDRILNEIRLGRLKVGDRLPPEQDYAVELGVSRSTLRLAFSELERAGVLHRRKRVGTQIVAEEPSRMFNMRTDGLHELLTLGRDTNLKITGKRTVEGSEIPLLNGLESATGYWLEVSGMRYLPNDTTPFNLSRIYVTGRYAGIEPVLGASENSVFTVIERVFGVSVSRVTQTTRAVACPDDVAPSIGLATGAPSLMTEAYLYGPAQELMEVSIGYFDPDRFQLNTEVEIG